MPHVVNRVRRGFYLDSVALMRLSQAVSGLPGVEAAAMMIGSVSNRRILDDAHLLAAEGSDAGAEDLVIAVRASSPGEATAALDKAEGLLDQPRTSSGLAGKSRSNSLDGAVRSLGGANLALVSVPGDFASGEARKALARGLHVMIFSDNVSYEEERALKIEAQRLGLLVMGPDCGTALIGGVPLAFANEVPPGNIGIVAASGTGLQEVSCLIARSGGGVSHGIGTGGRDLSEEIGALTTLAAIDALDADSGTSRIILISKPPAKAVAETVLARVAKSPKRFTICFLGAENLSMPANAHAAPTLAAAATDVLDGRQPTRAFDIEAAAVAARRTLEQKRRWIRGVYSGGTLCGEAQVVLRAGGEVFWSNAPMAPAARERPGAGHSLIDYGADEFTIGRPHPMIDPTLRNEGLAAALRDPFVAVVLFDVVIGYGAGEDPAGTIARLLNAAATPRPAIVASVTGTDADPQNRSAQIRTLEQFGVLVASSNAEAAELALAISRLSGAS